MFQSKRIIISANLSEPVERKKEMIELEHMKQPYILANTGDWKGFGKFFRDKKDLLDKVIDLHQSTPFHYAAHCRNPEIYKKMLKWLDESNIKRVLRLQNDLGNTPLHEVAFAGEVEMAKSILEHEEAEGSEEYQPLEEIINKLGETPVYRAAALGKTGFLKFFLEERLANTEIHFYRKDKMSILHVAVTNQFFDTALWLLNRYEKELANKEEGNGLTALQLLAIMPSAFKSQTKMGSFEDFLYHLLPDFQDYKYCHQNEDDNRKEQDLESGMGRNEPTPTQSKLSVSAFSWMCYRMWKALAKEWKYIDKLWRIKEMHNLTKELVRILAKNDNSWQKTSIARDRTVCPRRSHHITEETEGKHKEEQKTQEIAAEPIIYTPLLMAASNGITEIVEAIICFHPHSIEHASEDEQNILYMAVKHRQKKIYKIIKKSKMVRRLAGKIDMYSNTVLHYTAEFQGGNQPGYALQLQEELRWFDRIEKRLPYRYTIHKNHNNQTAKQLFMQKHEQLLKDAREWIKGTAQSCSAVAVLVATVVFAAAYTVPGGTDEHGLPRFRDQPTFLVFTIMDVVSLASSLGSVVMFLSILTSPCEMWDFRKSLPRKLMAGFALLFFSMTTTMLVFTATVLINIKLEKNKWTSSLTYSAAFFPVCIVAMVQFPLYLAIKVSVRSVIRRLKKITPSFLLKFVTWENKFWDI